VLLQQLEIVFECAMAPPELTPYFLRDFNELSELVEQLAHHNYTFGAKTQEVTNAMVNENAEK
jgi:hypothetical protein